MLAVATLMTTVDARRGLLKTLMTGPKNWNIPNVKEAAKGE